MTNLTVPHAVCSRESTYDSFKPREMEVPEIPVHSVEVDRSKPFKTYRVTDEFGRLHAAYEGHGLGLAEVIGDVVGPGGEIGPRYDDEDTSYDLTVIHERHAVAVIRVSNDGAGTCTVMYLPGGAMPGKDHDESVLLTPAERAVVAAFRASDLGGVRAVRALMVADKEDEPDDVEQEEDAAPDGDPVIGDRLRSMFDHALNHFQVAEELFLKCALKHGEPAGNPDLPILKQLLFDEAEDSLVDAISRLVRIGLIVDGQADHTTDLEGCDWNDFGIVVQTSNGPALVAFKVPLTSDGIRDVALGSAQVAVVDLDEVARLRQGKGIKRGFD